MVLIIRLLLCEWSLRLWVHVALVDMAAVCTVSTTYSIAVEPNHWKCNAASIWNSHGHCDHAAHGYCRRGNFGGSVFAVFCGWTIPLTAKVSEEVNRKCRPGNTTVQIPISYTSTMSATMHSCQLLSVSMFLSLNRGYLLLDCWDILKLFGLYCSSVKF